MIRHITFLLAAAAIVLTAAGQSPTIVGYEYWFDQNDGARTYVPVAPAQTVNLSNAPLNTSGLSLGPHVVNLRWKDQGPGGTKRWSSVVTRALQVGQPGPWEIVAVRYWVGNPANDADPLVRTKVFSTPQTVLSYNGSLDLCGYPTGTQTLKLQLLDNQGQWSSVVTRPVNISLAGSLGQPVITASSATFCPGDVITFTATPQLGSGFETPTGYTWQVPTGNGWSALPSDSSSIVVTIGDLSGTVQVTPSNFCGTGPSASLAIGIAPTPDQPSLITGQLQACAGSTVTFGTPAVPGITYAWAISGGWTASGGPGASITTTIGNTDANIAVTPFNACGVAGPTREAQISVTLPPNAGTNGDLIICSDAGPVNLFLQLQGTPDSGGVWSFNTDAVSGIYNPVLNSPGTYLYTVSGSGPCPDATATVTVIEPQAPNAGLDGTIALCSNAGPVSMTDALGGSPDANGTWSGPSSTAGQFDPGTMVAGVYTYTVSGTTPCANATASLTIAVQQAPNAGLGGTLELCTGAGSTDLLGALSEDPDPTGSWSGPQGPHGGTFTPGGDPEGVYTYTVPGAGICGAASATLNVNVMELVLSSIGGPLSVMEAAQLEYTAAPPLADADSITWTLPSGWTWAPDDTDPYDAVARVVPSDQAMVVSLCAQAFGGGCAGNEVCVTVDVTVGIEGREGEAAVVSVFPNPGAGRFILRSAEQGEELDVRVYDMLGQEVALFRHRGGELVMELRHLPAATYVLRWAANSRNGCIPIVVAP